MTQKQQQQTQPLLFEVREDTVKGLCNDYKNRDLLPLYTEIRTQFDKPYSHSIRQYWMEWCEENAEFVADKKGARYGYKKLYEEQVMKTQEAQDERDSIIASSRALASWLETRSPILWKEWLEHESGTF
jgi:hypothetical protein